MKNDNISIMLIWPCVEQQIEYIDKKINDELVVIENGFIEFENFKDFIIFCFWIYINESWIYKSGYKAISSKAYQCYGEGIKLYYYICEFNDIQQVDNTKKIIRDFCDKGKHSVHSTDNYSQFIYTNDIINLAKKKKLKYFELETMWSDVLNNRNLYLQNY